MNQIWQWLQNHIYVVDKDPPACCHVGNDPVGNKILDDWTKEYKGRITPEAFEEYRRRVLKSVGVERLRPPHQSPRLRG